MMKFCIASLLLASSATAVLYGDEQFGDIDGGKFWAFHSTGISIVNPENCAIERTFAADKYNLPTAWYDGVYMETNDKQGYAMINSGVTSNAGNEDGGDGEVLAISTNPKDYDDPIKGRVQVGGRPVHSYAVYERDEFWTHSDGNGHFYVINIDDVTQHVGKKIVAKVEDANHGKLLWDEGSHLQKHGFGTSTGERVVFVFDMESRETVANYNYTDDIAFYPYPNYCQGTHAISYSGKNNHIYVECTAGGGTLEFDVNDPVNPKFVAQHKDATGSLYETPDGSYVVAADKGGNKLHIFKPNGMGDASSIEFVVNVPGHPSTPVFYPKGDDFIACMPLTENTNKNHFNAQNQLSCDYYGCSGAISADDVAAGVCLHEEGSGKVGLQTVDLAEINQVESGAAPFNSACDRCKDSMNYDENGLCVCTPYCGSCSEPNYDPSNSGVQCVSMNKVVNNGVTETNLVPNAGSVLQGYPYSYSPQCGFGRTYRTHKRGGKYDASVAHFPVNSLQLVNMDTQSFHCQAALPGSPSRVLYVPPQKDMDSNTGTGDEGSSGNDSGNDEMESGTTASVGSIFAILFAAFVSLF